MTVTPAPPRPGWLRPLPESRPAEAGWPRRTLQDPLSQPLLDLTAGTDEAQLFPSRTAGAQVTTVAARWFCAPRPGLPDAAAWGASLAPAVLQAMLAQRPISQLGRWLADDVLTAVILHERQRRTERGRRAVPVTLRSLRVQHPQPEAAEVCAQLMVGRRHVALALRLEALGDRWLCTALELAPHPD